jgi:hypothetical protein
MTDNTETPTPQTSSDDSATTTIPVMRDNTFARAVADEATVLYLGRDVEYSFLQIGHTVIEKTIKDLNDEDVEEGFNLRPVLTETARIRMHQQSALFFALNIIDTLADAGRLNVDGLERSINRLLEKAKSRAKQTEEAEISDNDQ